MTVTVTQIAADLKAVKADILTAQANNSPIVIAGHTLTPQETKSVLFALTATILEAQLTGTPA